MSERGLFLRKYILCSGELTLFLSHRPPIVSRTPLRTDGVLRMPLLMNGELSCSPCQHRSSFRRPLLRRCASLLTIHVCHNLSLGCLLSTSSTTHLTQKGLLAIVPSSKANEIPDVGGRGSEARIMTPDASFPDHVKKPQFSRRAAYHCQYPAATTANS
nr:hypothetical protein CFP56_76225 [Quercus suber]